METSFPFFVVFVSVQAMVCLIVGLFFGTRITADEKSMGPALFLWGMAIGAVSMLMVANDIKIACCSLFLAFFLVGLSVTLKPEKKAKQ